MGVYKIKKLLHGGYLLQVAHVISLLTVLDECWLYEPPVLTPYHTMEEIFDIQGLEIIN